MSVVERRVEPHPPRAQTRRLLRRGLPWAAHPAVVALLSTLLAAVAATAGDPERPPRQQAAATAGTGRVEGHAYEESRRPDLPHRPLREVVVTLLPHSEALLQQLDAIRRGARDSHDAFRAAVPRMLETQEVHESAVRAAGGTVLTTRVASDGSFVLEGLTAGAWILVARHETVVPRIGVQVSKTDRKMYRVPPTLEASRTVRLWLREVNVPGGGVETVRLTDRNVWFTGVVEILAPPAR